MESTRHKPTRAVFRCGLTLLGLTCLLGTADARPKPSERFPGPWLEVRQEGRPRSQQSLKLAGTTHSKQGSWPRQAF